MAKYNGHKNHAAWNVSLWINNDETLYKTARSFALRMARDNAARALLEWLHECGITETPDGVRYTKTNIHAAMVGII